MHDLNDRDLNDRQLETVTAGKEFFSTFQRFASPNSSGGAFTPFGVGTPRTGPSTATGGGTALNQTASIRDRAR
jgi:hypothetical protein